MLQYERKMLQRADAQERQGSRAGNDEKTRVVLYSHDTVGLGHLRRNLVIGEALARESCRVLVVSGASEASAFCRPRGVELLTVPSLCKVSGRYESRSLRISLPEIVRIRARAIRAAVGAFRPHALIADKEPIGAAGELEPTLELLRKRGGTACVLGLRDVLDTPETVEREWSRAGNEEAIDSYYDTVWVYGDRSIYDPIHEYRLKDSVAKKIHFTGYIDRRHARKESVVDGEEREEIPEGRFVLCTSGGGEDGAHLSKVFAQASMPRGTTGVILTGPFMPAHRRRELEELAARRPQIRLVEFVRDPLELFRRADRVVAMGGYNTVCELTCLEQQILIVPRIKPRCEQLIRAERFRAAGALDYCHPDELSPNGLGAWLQTREIAPRRRRPIDFGGLMRIPELMGEAVRAVAARYI